MGQLRIIAGLISVALFVAGCGPGLQRPADLAALGVRDAARLIRDGRITSVELTTALFDRAEKNKQLNAFIGLDRRKALASAKQADSALAEGRVIGPLHGVPLVVKDNIHVVGLPSTAGTPGLRHFVPEQNAPVVQSLIDAGAFVLGKTNMHELAFGISGYNEAFYSAEPIGVRNPYNVARFAGGSSSGSGAAIAAGLAPGGLGSDTGGSVRIPAALVGVAGFRPSMGRYSQEGITALSHTRDTAGPMARTVADLALLDAVITGESPVVAANLEHVRLGVHRTYFYADLDAGSQTVMMRALEKLAAAGATVVEVDMPDLESLNDKVSFPIALYEAYDDLDAYLVRYGINKSVEAIAADIASADVRAIYDELIIPRKMRTPDGLVDVKPRYEEAMREFRPALQARYAETFARHGLDALIFPTTPHVAALQGPEASALETLRLFIRNCDPGSNAGIPGLSIPAGLEPSGLPVGVEIDGPQGSDRRLLSIGLAIEKALGLIPPPDR